MSQPVPTRTILLFVLLIAAIALAFGVVAHARAQNTTTASADKPFVIEYYYKAKWGHADEFLRLFKKNHLPVLRKQIEAGRMLRVSAVRPRYHATEDGRWDYKVTIVFKNLEAAFAPASVEEAIKKELFPDQETFKREEERRFEILLAHWDVPIDDVDIEH
ncbi:MAG TPA: hypothetical protein VJY33_13140 [Isosphaeraceae bacterium]|nr:hypothetical protein [Isosphaeraceae bacterium]